MHARFDPAASPPVVPAPNDLATDPSTGLLAVPLPPNASDADKALVDYLNTLDGFPADSPGEATFDANLDPATAVAANVRVFDVTAGYTEVTGLAVAATNDQPGAAKSRLDISPPLTGWKAGHTYALALVGGSKGIKGKGGVPVVGTAAWALVRSGKSLVTCADLKTNCSASTTLIPSTEIDAGKRKADQTAKALQLEGLRLKYKPVVDALTAQGVARADIPLAWTFKVAFATPSIAFQPAGAIPQVPLPNDLAIDPTTHLVNAPIDPRTSAANQEFTRDYLNTLDGFPVATTASAAVVGGTLDPASVKASTVIVLDLSPGTNGAPSAPPVVAISYDTVSRQIVVTPPAAGWVKGHTYAIAIAGGPHGVRSSTGGDVIGSDVWALVRGAGSLVTCTDLTSAACASAVHVISLSASDAVALERVRQGYQPLIAELGTLGLAREDIAAAWTFSAVSQPEATFDLANKIVPFPNDLLLSPDRTHVNLPVPPGSGLLTQLTLGLNTLDGFSTTADIVSTNMPLAPALTDNARLDSTTFGNGAAGVVKLAGGHTSPIVKPCVNDEAVAGCLFTADADAGHPQQFSLQPQAPLDEKTQYAAYLSTSMKARNGKSIIAGPAFALVRSENALVDATGESTIGGVPSAEAAQLEPLRLGLKPMFDGLAAGGLTRAKLALAWTFRTQSEITTLTQLNQVPAALGQAGALPATVAYLVDVTAATKDQLTLLQAPSDKIGKVFAGALDVAFLLNTPTGTFNPAAPRIDRIPFLLTTPLPPPLGIANPIPARPITIFSHGLHSYYKVSILLANSLAAANQSMIAIDLVDHGDRSDCRGAGPVASGSGLPQPNDGSDDNACADKTKMMCDESTTPTPTAGRCIAQFAADRAACDSVSAGGIPGDLFCQNATGVLAYNQGRCLADNKCEGGDFLRNQTDPFKKPTISGWNIISLTNLFATRDNFRQSSVDFSQLVRVIQSADMNAVFPMGLTKAVSNAGAVSPDANRINFGGQSLGGILGTLFTASNPTTHNVLLNVAGGSPVVLLQSSPAFAGAYASLKATLAGAGVPPNTAAFDQFLNTAKWILDPADPMNMGYGLTHSVVTGVTLPADRNAFVQYIEKDAVVPNVSTDRLLAGANRPGDALCKVYEFTNLSATDIPISGRHSFLLVPPAQTAASLALTTTAQTQAATFFATGATP